MRLGTSTKLGAIQIGSLGVPLRGQAVVNRAPHFTGLGPSGFHPARLRPGRPARSAYEARICTIMPLTEVISDGRARSSIEIRRSLSVQFKV